MAEDRELKKPLLAGVGSGVFALTAHEHVLDGPETLDSTADFQTVGLANPQER